MRWSRWFYSLGSMKISDEANKAMERSQIQEGDILMTITGNVGRVCIYPTGLGNGNINQHIAKIRISNKRVIPNFVYYFLSQSGVIKNYNKITTGQAYPQLSLKQVRETLVPLPSQKEQLLVCKMLEATDQNIEILKEKFKNYNSLKIGLMQNLLTGTIRVNSLLQKENLA